MDIIEEALWITEKHFGYTQTPAREGVSA